MDTTTIIGFSGIIATIVIGIAGIMFAKKKQYRGEITLIEEEYISLFNDIIKNMPELQISYMERPVKENLVLFKGYLLNTGSKDIADQMVVRKLEIKVPEGSKWVRSKVVDSSENVNASIENSSDTSIIFDLGLFRCNEYLKFECLAEMLTSDNAKSPSKFLKKNIKVKHRIADTGKTNQISMPSVSRMKHPWHCFGGIFAIIALLTIAHVNGISTMFNYKIDDSNGNEIEVTLKRNFFGELIIKQNDGEYKEVCSPEHFFEVRSAKITSLKDFEKYFYYFLAAIFLFIIIILMIDSRDFYRNKRINLLLKSKFNG